MVEFPSKYKFSDSEKKWQQFWQKQGVYLWDRNETRDRTYVVDTPPPTVSGQLHIGHVYSYTHTDFIVRYQRMKGMNIFYPMGFDDNGLPTERLVEAKRKVRASSMNREEFIAICQDVVEVEEAKFHDLFNRIALSVDWNIEYRTISPISCKISQMSFLDLIQKEQIYRDSQPMLWDPVDQTALAQADIEDHEKTTFMNDIQFTTEDGKPIIIATTRPELLPACVAVLFHPDDTRYNKLAGKFAISPLFSVKVPLLADDMVDPVKGTGLVMCCTFGDQTDILWWRKHKLPTKIIFSKWGTIAGIEFDDTCMDKEKAEKFAMEIVGMKIIQAREKIIELLKNEGLLSSQTERIQTVKCAERSGSPLEILTTPQWFIKAVNHKDELAKRSNELNWHPYSMKIKLDSWIQGVSLDWCISRQRYFGVPFPVWYSKRRGEEGKILLAKPEQLPVDPLRDLPIGYAREEVEADKDVMDTWSTSSVSPQLSSHGIAQGFMVDQERHKALFPADLRPQAHEILRTWAYYTLLKSHLHENTLPWKNIMISGWCLAEDRSKMSKSKGNVLVPDALLEQFGADVVRYWSASSRLGADTAYSVDAMNNGKRLVNKLWNAAKFVSQHFDKIPSEYKNVELSELKDKICCDFDKYFITRLSSLVSAATSEFEKYEYAGAMDHTEQFFWFLFCDNYLEITKTRAYDEENKNAAGALSARLTLYHSLKIILKLFAPFLPHITEELYQLLYTTDDSIHRRGSWPVLDLVFNGVDKSSKQLIEVLEMVRKVKAKDNLSIKAPISYIEIAGKKSLSDDLITDLQNVTSTMEIRFVSELSSKEQELKTEIIEINVVYSK
ncbi:Valine--tRNA ligase [Candidatus Megaera venefica]|uniref:Valine--tRNA ligase n=1 Tax=Candidatus Megaera venefica TaxID=2055910 RepID=A0ABU5NE45_9RICK|nr:valine--tRNA ligase [Candidatus Megaera venefica]MEA0971425.1 Valine--tRNA ligase [Candidatus Megaera venefica]